MKNSTENISVYTQSGHCLTPFGTHLIQQVEKIKNANTAITLHQKKQFCTDSFYGSIIEDELLETAFETLRFKGEFTRLEKMMLIVGQQLILDFKEIIDEKCGVIFSTTKGNIDALETPSDIAYFLPFLAKKVCKTLGLNVEPIVLSNACVSGIMAISVAKRLIQSGEYNHFIIIGGDIFSRFVFSGFQSFQAISKNPCRPYDKCRDGISLGEAAASILVSKDKHLFDTSAVFEIVGESSINDANHISGPSRTGEGLFQSVENAINEAGIGANQIDCISAHGTATIYNDEMEAQAFNRSQLSTTPLYSLKSYFGHTLGAAGLLETVFGLQLAKEQLIPASLGYEEHGLTLPLHVNKQLKSQKINYLLKTASGFGGCNTAVIFKKCT